MAGLSKMKPSMPSPRDSLVVRLDLRGPVRLGILAIVAAAGLVGAVLATLPLGSRILLADLKIEETQRVAVRHAKGGIISQVHVKAGDVVGSGDLLVTLDTRDLDEQIAALKMQAEAAAMKLAGVRKEAQLLANIADTSPSTQMRKSELERRLVDVERETIGLQVRIAHAEQDVVRAEIRSPIAGRVLELAELSGGKIVSEGAKVVELQPSMAKFVLAGRAIDAHRNDLIPGRSARVTLLSPVTHRAESFEARVLEQDGNGAAGSGAAERIRVELKTTFETFKTRIGANEHLAGELRLGRVDVRADTKPAAAAVERAVSARPVQERS